MQNNNQNIQRYEEDEIDLKELFRTLLKRKKFIILFTAVITIAAIAYAYAMPKVYEAKVILKIGEYRLTKTKYDANTDSTTMTNTKSVLADASELSKELEILFIDIVKNKKDREAQIESIGLLKQQNNFLEITALSSSNKLAIAEINKVVNFVQANHKKKLDDVMKLHETNAKQVEAKLALLKNKMLPAIEEKIARYKKDIEIYETNFNEVQKNLQKIKSVNPTLAAIQINEQRYLADMLMKLKDSLEQSENEKNDIEVVRIEKFKEELSALKVLMKPYNYRNTEVIGNIMTNDYAIKPKKKLIVVVAFVTGFILSIFLVFFMEFIQGMKRDEEEKSSVK